MDSVVIFTDEAENFDSDCVCGAHSSSTFDHVGNFHAVSCVDSMYLSGMLLPMSDEHDCVIEEGRPKKPLKSDSSGCICKVSVRAGFELSG